jgi:hypothetical protein
MGKRIKGKTKIVFVKEGKNFGTAIGQDREGIPFGNAVTYFRKADAGIHA